MLENLPNAKFVDEIKIYEQDRKLENISIYNWLITFSFLGIPIVERFCFCLNTALNDIAYLCSEYSLDIIEKQVSLIVNITQMIIEYGTKNEYNFSESGNSCFVLQIV